MKTIWGILTVVSVGIITLLFLAKGSESGRLQEDLERLRNSDQVKAALAKLEEFRARISASLVKLQASLEDPEFVKIKADVTAKLNQGLKDLTQNVEASSAKLKATWNQVSQDVRAKALDAYEKLKDELDKLETQVALTVIGIRAAAKRGGQELEAQKAKLEEHLKKVEELKQKLQP